MNQPFSSLPKKFQLFTLTIVLLAFSSPLPGFQGDRGTIEGVVKDPSGIEVGGVRIVIAEEQTGSSRTVMTGEMGRFRARNLPSGNYTITASMPLYKESKITDQVLVAGQVLKVELVLNLGEMSEIVVQSGTGSILDAAGGAEGRIYYLDSAEGSDDNDGLEARAPWKSLEKANSHVFQPGDKLLLKAGSHFHGQLKPQGSGYRGASIVVDMYGEGAKPLIAAEGQFAAALFLENQSYWEVNNLELTNTGPSRELFRNGVWLLADNFGTMKHIHLKNLFVHDVNGSLKKGKGEGYGIVMEHRGESTRSRFDGVLIEDCHLVRTDRNGICGLSSYRPQDAREFPCLNVVVRGNLLEDIGGDAIKIWGCNGALVEHNTVRGARTRCDDYAAGIWPWASDNTVIQFNEVSGVKGKKDGQAFDSDAHTTNTLFQYNYSHDNEGGFMLICCFDNRGTVVRYNISQNDQTRLFHMAGSNEDIQIYNNVFYVGKGLDVHLFLWTGRESNWTRNVEIFNNVFLVEGVARNSSGEKRKPIQDGTFITTPGFGGSTNVVFEKNTLVGNFKDTPDSWKTMKGDPGLVAPGGGGSGFESTEGYKLRATSPLIGAGRSTEDSGGRDFWGNPLPSKEDPSIGVHEPPR
jgi:hypothetical protein